ncbi:hydrogenase maturation nickel metallochaperone HypA/HybF [Nitrococcus mobilis]|uniref:Hydrogenase maturation factor HypA n=1 Tax=Nitrococcus mobilis Nb-231 TaxID=314278 RepID=A4BQ11_9GAMM|nr:hydrogenase maturation nickel metallochaperone HypA [Nitrococcus mobilis]EAR22166.1 hydrogenase expression/formation protein [Nitrococcus mobilis Nb-231]
MHELALTRSLIEVCSQQAQGARILRVTVEVGALTCVMPEALRFCFEACSVGTALADAELEIIMTPGWARCRDCGEEVELNELLADCGCGSVNLAEWRGGDALRIRSMEVV